MTDRFEELIWVELDGVLGAEEARELADLRSGSVDAAGIEGALEAEIRELAAGLSTVEDIAAPADLTRRILAAVEPSRPLADESRGSGSEVVAPFARPAAARGGGVQWRRWGYLAAVLLIAGIVLYQLAAKDVFFGSTSELAGTVPPAADPGPPPDSGQRPETPDFVRLTQRDGRLLAAIEPGRGESTFVFSAPGLELEQVDFESGATGSYEEGPNQITLRVAGPGRVAVRLLLARPERPVTFSASGGDFEPFEGEFVLHQLLGGSDYE